MSRDDLIQLEGVVTKVLGAGIMEIDCDNDITVRGRLSGRMKKFRIKVLVGDRNLYNCYSLSLTPASSNSITVIDPPVKNK